MGTIRDEEGKAWLPVPGCQCLVSPGLKPAIRDQRTRQDCRIVLRCNKHVDADDLVLMAIVQKADELAALIASIAPRAGATAPYATAGDAPAVLRSISANR